MKPKDEGDTRRRRKIEWTLHSEAGEDRENRRRRRKRGTEQKIERLELE